MICPVCNNVLIVVEYNQIELDYCTQCKGVWFDAQELELLLKSLNLSESEYHFNDILSLPEQHRPEIKRKCPICRKKMKKVCIGQDSDLLVDVCFRKEGLWFDGGEVMQLIKQLKVKPAGKEGGQQYILDFLGEIFNVEKPNN